MKILARMASVWFVLCVGLLNSLPAVSAKDRVEREWTISTQPMSLRAQLVDGSVGAVRLRVVDQSITSVPLSDLAEADQKYVSTELGLDVVDLTGVWRSESGTYYSMTEGRDGKVYMRMIESPHLKSIEGTLRHKDAKVVSEQWLVVFKTDPTATPRSGSTEFYRTPNNEVRFKYDFIFLDDNGKEKKNLRKKVTSSFVRLDYEEIPERILVRYFPRPKTAAEKRSEVIKKILLWWFSRTAAKSFDPREGWGKAVIHVALMRASDKSLQSALRDVLADLDEDQAKRLAEVINLWLNGATKKDLRQESLKEAIAEVVKTNAPELSGAAGVVEFIYDVEVARRRGFE